MTTPTFHAKSTKLQVVKGFNANIDGKLVLITDCTSGIAIETARALATVNAHVVIIARDMNKGVEVVEDLKKTTGNDKIEVMKLVLIEHSVIDLTYISIILLTIDNGGVIIYPYGKIVNGFETQFRVNHLSHFLLATRLIPKVKVGTPSHVVIKKIYDKWLAYGQSIREYALHPGGLTTNLARYLPIEEQLAMGCASTSVYAALASELDNHGEEYLENCAISQGVNRDMKTFWSLRVHAIDMESAERLWKLSEQLVAAK
ncbi:unnamed protein product [Rotaria sordida]|uniref:Uncharacterized protein n=1 Tax=Rotaria sordida TaxID=392033 RepID=A0A818SFX6_9BILA|nr:unnamed protein product [Rotaria sordida]CAF3764354.1 unnamed protein product [Rotaria sordida]